MSILLDNIQDLIAESFSHNLRDFGKATKKILLTDVKDLSKVIGGKLADPIKNASNGAFESIPGVKSSKAKYKQIQDINRVINAVHKYGKIGAGVTAAGLAGGIVYNGYRSKTQVEPTMQMITNNYPVSGGIVGGIVGGVPSSIIAHRILNRNRKRNK